MNELARDDSISDDVDAVAAGCGAGPVRTAAGVGTYPVAAKIMAKGFETCPDVASA